METVVADGSSLGEQADRHSASALTSGKTRWVYFTKTPCAMAALYFGSFWPPAPVKCAQAAMERIALPQPVRYPLPVGTNHDLPARQTPSHHLCCSERQLLPAAWRVDAA